MATLLQSASHFAANSPNTLAFPNAVSAGSLLVAYSASTAVSGTTTVSDNVNGSYTAAVATQVATIWYLANSAPGSTTVTMTFTSSILYLIIEEWAGVNTSSPLDQIQFHSGTSVTTGNTGTTPTLAQASELAVAAAEVTGSGTVTVVGPFTVSPSSPASNASASLNAGYLLTSSTAGVSANFNFAGSTSYRAVIATFKIPTVSAPPIGSFIATLP